MRESIQGLSTNLKSPKFIELAAFFILLLTLTSLDVPPIYHTLSILLLVAGVIVTALSVIRPHHYITAASVLTLMALATGMLQFNYIPSLALWLLILIRLIFSDTKYTVSLVLLTVAVGLLSLISAHFLLPAISLTAKQEDILNFVIVLTDILIVGYHICSLVIRLRQKNQMLAQQQARIDTLVNVTNKLTRFLPPQIWQPIVKNNTKVEVINQRRKLTILFSDIVGFTDLSDHISPDHLANILNTYLDRMTQVSQKYGATLDKFLGDGLLCYFGDVGGNDRDNAIACASMAIEMRREMEVLRHQWRLLGFEGLHVRMGINTGYCYVGNFGSRNRMTYTVVGKEANFASRLESAAQNNQILISESTFNLIGHVHHCQAVGQFKFKGFQDAMNVWELLEPKSESMQQTDWVDFSLPGFNLHLNFHDIRNYDKNDITNQLKSALALVEEKHKQ